MTRLSALAIVLGLFAAGCNTTTAPTTTAAKPTFTAQLLPSNEVPPITNAESTGSGNVTVTLNVTRDATGNITAATVDFLATFSGFPAGTVATVAHIHQGAATCACPVVISTAIAAGEVTFPNGSGSLVKSGVTVSPVDLANALLNNPSGFYFNIHTANNPGGVARGQLARSQ